MDEAMGDSSTSLPALSASETDQQQQAVGPPVYCQASARPPDSLQPADTAHLGLSGQQGGRHA